MAAIKPEAFTHMCFVTGDLGAMEDWYGRMFGWEPHSRFTTWPELTRTRTGGDKDTASVILGELDGRGLEIGQYEPLEPVRKGFCHFGIRVSDVDAAYRHAVEVGAKIAVEPFEPVPGLRIFFVEDPDGNQIEIGNLPDLSRPQVYDGPATADGESEAAGG